MDAKTYYNSIAKGYSNLYHKEQKNKINLIKNQFPIQGTVLDLACGDGILNQFLSKNVKLYSFDISDELLKLNSNKKENKFQGNSTKLPFKSNKFDAICSFTALQDIEDLENTFKEMKRVLKKEGQIIISFLKISKKKDKIIKLIENNFNTKKRIEEEKDLIFICENKNN